MATHSSVLAWRIPGMGEPGGLPSMGLRRIEHDWSDLAAAGQGCITRTTTNADIPVSRIANWKILLLNFCSHVHKIIHSGMYWCCVCVCVCLYKVPLGILKGLLLLLLARNWTFISQQNLYVEPQDWCDGVWRWDLWITSLVWSTLWNYWPCKKRPEG